jgi:chromosome partitioning protein
MIVIAPANNKGGVGKTKISIILAEYFSQVKGMKVLAIDFDSQCNFSQRFLKMRIDPALKHGKIPPVHPDYDPDDPDDAAWDGISTIADIFYGTPNGIIPYPTHIKNLDITPAHAAKLLEAEAKRPTEIVEKIHLQLKSFLWDTPEVANAYDIVIIDTAPSKGPLTIAAIKAATHMLIPSVMEEQPIQGIYGMMQLWMQESLERPKDQRLDLIGILPNLLRRNTNLHQDMLNSLKSNPQLSKYVIPHELAQRTIFAEVDSEHASPRCIFDLPDSNKAKKEALQFCEYVERRIKA